MRSLYKYFIFYYKSIYYYIYFNIFYTLLCKYKILLKI